MEVGQGGLQGIYVSIRSRHCRLADAINCLIKDVLNLMLTVQDCWDGWKKCRWEMAETACTLTSRMAVAQRRHLARSSAGVAGKTASPIDVACHRG